MFRKKTDTSLKPVKSTYRAVLTNQDLKQLIRTALTSCQQNFKQLTGHTETHKITN